MKEQFYKMIERIEKRRVEDAQRYADLDGDECQLCGAHGEDKRSLLIRCFYDIHEVIPEAISTVEIADFDGFNGYYLRICKYCRGKLLGHLQNWRNEQVSRRGIEKDHDGYADGD